MKKLQVQSTSYTLQCCTVMVFIANKDYLPVDLSIALSNTERTMCYDVVILDDDIVEVSESFSVELVDVIGRFRVLQTTADITIIPNIEDSE